MKRGPEVGPRDQVGLLPTSAIRTGKLDVAKIRSSYRGLLAAALIDLDLAESFFVATDC